MSIKAVIPVRSGSKRVVNKNSRAFADSNLLEIKIKQLLKVPELDGIIVNSDDENMLDIAASLGVAVSKRDSYFASDTVPMSEVYVNIAKNIDSANILLTHVTNPLAGPDCYSSAIHKYIESHDQYDSVTSVSEVKEFLYWDGKPVNYDPQKKPRSQDLPNIVKLNHVISISSKASIISRRDMVGVSPLFLTLSALESFDIDTELDFSMAEFLYRKYISDQN